jgi:hypothetical protein
VGLAPAETNPTAIGVCGNITVPALIFSGSSDGVTPPAEHHIPIYQGIASTCKSFVSITGGAHCYFANSNFNCDFGEGTSSQGISISRAEQQQRTYAILDPWLQYVLGQDCFALHAFQSSLTNTAGTLNQTTCSSPGMNATIYYDNLYTLWTTTPGTGYQWYVNGQIMQGETNDSIVLPVDFGGNFTVSVYSPNGCDTSNFITIQGSIQVIPLDYQLIYQAGQDKIQITTNTPYTGSVNLQDIHGRMINQEVVNATNITFSSSQLAKGVYFVQLGNVPAKRILVY